MTQHYLRHINIEQVIAQVPGLTDTSLRAALGQSADRLLNAVPKWHLVTPVNSRDQALAQTKFFKSIIENVDDAKKQSTFLASMVTLLWAQQQQNLPEYLSGLSSPIFKVASSFKFQGSSLSIHELKGSNKDRVYLQTHTPKNQGAIQAVILYLSHHKKDQTTPSVVKGYCHAQASNYLNKQNSVVLLKD